MQNTKELLEAGMKKILFIFSLMATSSVNAEITTREQADKFLDNYCIALVNEIQKAVEKQKQQAA
jgi:hypothetical protein